MRLINELNVLKRAFTFLVAIFSTTVLQAQDETLAGPSGCNGQAVNGTWDVPCDVTSITIEVYGGGGGAGGSGGGSDGGVFNTRGGGGAGAGGFTTITIDVVPGSTFSYTAGQGGCGGDDGADFNDGDNGSNGGTSSFSGTDANGVSISLTANGGSRGTGGDGTGGSTGSGGTGGTAAGGTTNTAGGSGGNGSSGDGGAGGSTSGPNGGDGGAPDGGNGTNYGAGGAGGGDSNGGDGAEGAILITYETQGSFTPDVVGLPATCTQAGSATISNYDSGLTYDFFPSGPSVGTGGIVTGAAAGSLYTVVASVGACTSDPSSPFSIEDQLVAPIVEVTGNLTTCEGELASLTASGASSYLWDDPSTTTTANIMVVGGTYTVTGTNSAGCSGTATVTVMESAVPEVDLGNNQSVCGEATVNLDAGSGFVSYLWSNGATTQTTDVGPGTQWVEVGDGTCTGSDTILIISNPLPDPSLSPNGAQVICDGGSLMLDAGSGFANYEWTPNGEQTQTIEVTASGSYSVAVLNDAGCQGNSDTVTVTIENLSDVTILADGPVAFCEGDSVMLDAGSGYDTYLWSNGDTTQTTTVQVDGSYSVSGTSGGCPFGSDTVDVSISSLQVSITANGTELSVDAGFVSYQWFINGNPIPGATSNSYTATSHGNYAVQVTDATGCTGSATLEFTLPDGINDVGVDVPFTIYPNPSEGQFQLKTDFNESYSIVVMNGLGQRILEQSATQENRAEINIETAGTYLLQVIVGETVYHKKLVVE